METRRDLKVNGYMSLSGGIFNDVEVNGGVELSDAVDCINLYANGMININGGLKADYARIKGKAYVKGSLDCGDFIVSGRADIDGGAKVKKLGIEGSAVVKGAIDAEEITVKGEIKSSEGINAESFHGMGRFRIEGLLNADKIRMEIFAGCRVGEMGGQEITVKRSRYRLGRFVGKILRVLFGPGFHDGLLEADTIEGDEIYLEYTDAKIVRGRNVTIGEGCRIGLVEYKDTFRQGHRAIVEQSKKV